MSHALVTGASGFFGGILKRRLLAEGHGVVNIDLQPDDDAHPNLISIRGDLRDRTLIRQTFAAHRFDAVYHCAAQLAHGKLDCQLLWTSNVDATQILCEAATEAGVRPFVFISTNCLWASDLGRPVDERDTPNPIELYGESKLAAEQVVQSFASSLDAVILRSPTIMDRGRLGLLAILFEFIDDGRTLWVVGPGTNRYQFIYAQDLATACILAALHGRPDLFHIGSDDVPTMRELYESVINHSNPAARRRSRVRSLPERPTLLAMQLAHSAGVSPLGPYHYKMIAESFRFDTSRIKRELAWSPTLTNSQMLLTSYQYFAEHRTEIAARTDASAHRKASPMGIIRLLKWLS